MFRTKASELFAYTGMQPYAATSADNGTPLTFTDDNSYTYDANGNQETRTVNGQTFDLDYDAENRLVSVTGPNVTASFVYDGDGRQVKSTINGIVTTFVGAHYQIVNGTVTKYYFAGASRIAMRTGSTLTYLLGDHLGSTSLTTDTLGNLVSELRYKPWGETRYSSGTTATSYRYTGQREEVIFGLYFYNARWMDPALGRFVQADTLVPGGIQGLDRYAYVGNSPVRYIDPSGHTPCASARWDDGPQCFIDGKPKNIRIPDWDSKFGKYVSEKDKRAAVRAYLDFISDPLRFAEYYVNPAVAPIDYDYLEIFAEYSTLHTTADQLVWNAVAQTLGMDAAEALSNAKLHNLEIGLDTTNDNTADNILTAASVFSVWYKSTFPSEEASLAYHYSIHGGPWSSPEAYTRAAQKFYATNINLAEPYILQDGAEGIRIVTRQYYGIYTVDGQIVTFAKR
ncbi:MAG: RHS repeat-associated core domain-containing protein [Chloroflexi bacterium]|nr:RHS repeat-associated core domain-containing protein [Chloroflexota bacterium]